jgi:hypothetical protein
VACKSYGIKKTHISLDTKGVYFAGTKIFNHLPENIKKLSDNTKKFKSELKKFLLLGSFFLLKNSMDGHQREIFMLHTLTTPSNYSIRVY